MTQLTDTTEAIAAANQSFMDAFSQGDAAGVADIYTEDAQFMPQNSDFVNGRQAIQAVFQGLMDMGIKTITLKTREIEDFGGIASEVGTYALKNANGELVDQGKFLVLWKQEAGQWKLYRDMINTSLPAAK